MNFLEIDVLELNLPAFFAAGTFAFVAAYLCWLVLIWWQSAIRWAWAPIFLALMAWFWTTFPLPGIWGLAPITDRMRNLWACATAAAGNSPWESGVIGQFHLEPLWAVIVSLLSLRDAEWVLRLYPFLPALVIVLFGLSLRFSFAVEPEGVASGESESLRNELRALFVIFFALLVAAPPLDFLGAYNGSVAKIFLHKPNHVIALALVPVCLWLVVRTISKPFSFLSSAVTGLLLGVLGWAFIMYWILFCLGLVFGGILIASVKGFGRQQLRLGVILLVSLAIVLPYVYYLKVNFPPAVSLSAGTGEDLRSPWDQGPPPGSSLLFLATFDLGLTFYLGLYGVWTVWRRRNRFELMWLGLLTALYAAWAGSAVLYAAARSRGAIHVYTLLVVVMAIFSGLGVYDLVERGGRRLALKLGSSLDWLGNSSRLTAVVLLLLLPTTLPSWWKPEVMDDHFRLGLTPIPKRYLALGEWIRDNTKGSDTLLAAVDAGAWIPAVSGRQVRRLLKPSFGTEDYWDECALLEPTDPDELKAAVARLGVSYIVSTPAFLTEHVTTEKQLNQNPFLERVFQTRGVTVYSIATE